MHQFQPGSTHKMSLSTEFKNIPHGTSLKWSQRPSQLAQVNSPKICDETGHPVLSLTGNQ